MLSKDKFKLAISEVEALIGQPISRDQRAAIFKRIESLNEQDFIMACNDEDFLREAAKFKFSYPLLRGYITRYAERRHMKEAEQQKKNNEIALKTILKDEKTPEEVKAFLRGFDKTEVKNNLLEKRKITGKRER